MFKNLAFGDLCREFGLLLLRLGIGVSVIALHHGYANLVGGPEVWEKIGKGMVDLFGVNIPPLFPGVAVAVIVFFWRPAADFGGAVQAGDAVAGIGSGSLCVPAAELGSGNRQPELGGCISCSGDDGGFPCIVLYRGGAL